MRKAIVSVILLAFTSTFAGFMWGYAVSDDNAISDMIQEFGDNDTYCSSTADTDGRDDQGEVVSERKTNNSDRDNRLCYLIIPNPYREIIYTRANKYQIEPSLVGAVITVESNWDSNAVSPVGAIGLMQLMPATAKDMGVNDPFNPGENIEGGIRYLRYLLDRFDGDVTLALASYNAGPGRIETFKGIPPIRETQHYVTRVLAIYNNSEEHLI